MSSEDKIPVGQVVDDDFQNTVTPEQADAIERHEAHRPKYTPPPITGYRTLSQTELNLVNEGKALAEQCGVFVAKLRGQGQAGGEVPAGLDQRWVSIGATQIQQGFMAVIRGITQPTTF